MCHELCTFAPLAESFADHRHNGRGWPTRRRMKTHKHLLLIGAIVTLVLSGCKAAKPEQAPVAPGLQFTTVDTIKDMMDSIVDPNADFLWDSISTSLTLKGVVHKEPHTDEEWQEARRHAVTLVEATNLLLVPNRHVAKPGEKADDPNVEEPPEAIEAHINQDRATFDSRIQRLRETALATLTAIDKKDATEMEQATDRLDKACEACHLTYWYPKDGYAQRLYNEETSGGKK
jgi:hypothetical protein